MICKSDSNVWCGLNYYEVENAKAKQCCTYGSCTLRWVVEQIYQSGLLQAVKARSGFPLVFSLSLSFGRTEPFQFGPANLILFGPTISTVFRSVPIEFWLKSDLPKSGIGKRERSKV